MNELRCIVGFLLILLVVGCNERNKLDDSKMENKLLPVTKLITKDTTLSREYVGDIHAVKNVEIRARIQGYLEKIYVDEGQEVKKGQPLFRINDEEYEEGLTSAKANLKSVIAEAKAAALEVDRVKLLVEKGVVSKTELEVVKAKLDAAQARIEEAQSAQKNSSIKLSYTYIKAPFDGIIDRIPFKVGSLINEGSLLTTVSDLNSVYTYFNVSEREYLEYFKARLRSGNANVAIVELILADGSKYSHKGKIETMEGEFQASTGSIAFRAKFPNPTKILKHGSSGKIRLTNDVNNALIVPQKATFEIQDKCFVFVVDSNNIVKMKSFKPKNRFANFYIIESGLLAGENVVYEGVKGLREGMVIDPQLISMDSLFSKEVKIQTASVKN